MCAHVTCWGPQEQMGATTWLQSAVPGRAACPTVPPCSLVGTAAAQTANSPLREVEQEVGLGAMLGEHLGSRKSIMRSRVCLEFTLCSHATCHGLAPRSESCTVLSVQPGCIVEGCFWPACGCRTADKLHPEARGTCCWKCSYSSELVFQMGEKARMILAFTYLL